MTEITCGVFLVDSDNKLLIVHSTNAPWTTWGIPKGLLNPGEAESAAAVRELFEETGIKIDEQDLVYLGSAKYNKRNKILRGFYAKVDFQIDPKTLSCTSYVERKDGNRFPEVDKFLAIHIDDADKMLHHSQVDLLASLRNHMIKSTS